MQAQHFSTVKRTDNNSDKKKWAIVGGGMLGLTLAMRMAKQGHDITLIDQLGCRRIPLENGRVADDDDDAFVDEYAAESVGPLDDV